MANFKENKKYHFTYRTTNLINNRYYLGMHSTNRTDDGYLGSGKRLYYELNKYGRDNFKFKILKQFNSREELVQAEINLITEQDLKNPNCLNCKPGGQGGLSSEEHRRKFLEGAKSTQFSHSKNPSHSAEKKKRSSEKMLQMWSEGKIPIRRGCFLQGEKHRPETIEKMKGHTRQQGEKNSQYGKRWIYREDLQKSKAIHSSELEKYISLGWSLGRRNYK